jgi:hypothetical protein
MQLDFTTLLSPDAALWGSPLLPPRFWSKVNPHGPVPPHCPELGPCWVWTAALLRGGYGHFWVGSRSDGTHRLVSAHRHIYAALVGPIPEGLHVCHHCDNPSCARPGHLFVGTQADNAADRERKGRHNPARGERHGSVTHPERLPRGERNGSVLHPERLALGERNGSAKLNAAKVLEIRRLARKGVSQRAIARQYGVTHILIGKVIRRENWRHV